MDYQRTENRAVVGRDGRCCGVAAGASAQVHRMKPIANDVRFARCRYHRPQRTPNEAPFLRLWSHRAQLHGTPLDSAG